MRNAAMVMLGLLLAAVVLSGPIVEQPAVALTGEEEITMPEHLIGFTPEPSPLDLIGDTLIVGSTGWDAQHNASCGRMIGYSEGPDWLVDLVWSKLYGLTPSAVRHVVHTQVMDDGLGGFMISPLPATNVEAGYRSGYTTLAWNSGGQFSYPTFHYQPTAPSATASYATSQNAFVPNIFNLYPVPAIFAWPHIWPHATWGGGGGGGGYVHMVSHPNMTDNSEPAEVSYMRWEVVPATNTLTAATPGGNPFLISSVGMNISEDIVTNAAGNVVAAAVAVSRRFTLGEENGDWSGTALGQSNNDIYIYPSTNSGQSFNAPVDITQFIGPNATPTPDTTTANRDTLRAYSDCSLVFDGSNRLHAAFTAGIFDYWRQIVYYESRLFHWMRDNQGNDIWTQIYHQPFAGQPESWGRSVDRPSLYFDNDTGILWCSMEVTDWGPDTTDWGNSGKVNRDVFISASPPGPFNGLLWTKPVNVTNTKWLNNPPAPAGSCRSEMCATLALNSDGDYLHLFYTLDLDAGVGISSVPEGTVTDNPMVYHRISKQALLDQFETNAEWVVNYPLHVDESGYWDDPGNWEWAQYGGFFTTDRTPGPVTLDLTGINTVIPAGGGNVTYSVHLQSTLAQTYPNVTYWTRATLPNNTQTGVLFSQQFTLTPFMNVTVSPVVQQIPNYAPGGVYTYTGYVGFYPNAQLQDSFNFTKLGPEPDGSFEFNPEDWAVTMGSLNGAAEAALPREYSMSQAYPNPFNPSTSFSVNLPAAADLTVTVFNVNGREVATLTRGWHAPGEYTLTFDASEFASGIYFIEAAVPGEMNRIQKVTLLK